MASQPIADQSRDPAAHLYHRRSLHRTLYLHPWISPHSPLYSTYDPTIQRRKPTFLPSHSLQSRHSHHRRSPYRLYLTTPPSAALTIPSWRPHTPRRAHGATSKSLIDLQHVLRPAYNDHAASKGNHDGFTAYFRRCRRQLCFDRH